MAPKDRNGPADERNPRRAASRSSRAPSVVAGLAGVGPAEFGRRDGLQVREDAGGVVAAAERAENEQFVG